MAMSPAVTTGRSAIRIDDAPDYVPDHDDATAGSCAGHGENQSHLAWDGDLPDDARARDPSDGRYP
jgi:hypothetical protein